MLFGHNSNVKVGDTTFHVQTEDRGVTTALIDTTVYYMGRVMHRRTNNYHDLVPLDPDREEALRLRLDEQHRSTLEDIRSGILYLAAPQPPASAKAAEPSLAKEARLSESPTSTANGANANAADRSASANGGATASDPANPQTFALKLELRNARSWLSGKQATLEVYVATQTGEPLEGATVRAYVEGAATSEQHSGETDLAGITRITFEMPSLTGSAPAALAIEANWNHGEPMSRASAQGKLRFALRTKPRPV